MRGEMGPLGWCIAGFKFEPRDLWVGVYWDRPSKVIPAVKVYVCVVPMLPLIVHFDWRP